MSEKEWEQAAKDLRDAQVWNDLPNGPKRRPDSFAISKAHCTLQLVRAGQQSHGGQNYWEAPEALTNEIIAIIAKDGTIIERAIESLRRKKQHAMMARESWLREQLDLVCKAKKESVDD